MVIDKITIIMPVKMLAVKGALALNLSTMQDWVRSGARPKCSQVVSGQKGDQNKGACS